MAAIQNEDGLSRVIMIIIIIVIVLRFNVVDVGLLDPLDSGLLQVDEGRGEDTLEERRSTGRS